MMPETICNPEDFANLLSVLEYVKSQPYPIEKHIFWDIEKDEKYNLYEINQIINN